MPTENTRADIVDLVRTRLRKALNGGYYSAMWCQSNLDDYIYEYSITMTELGYTPPERDTVPDDGKWRKKVADYVNAS
jgi:hypothetical protein